MARGITKKNKIFICWSGESSKKIATELKSLLERKIFSGTGLICFVSELDIASGTDWWNKIQRELKTSKIGILCITKENLSAPWIYFEAGAMVAHGVRTIPLLINCHGDRLEKTPINRNHRVDFHSKQQFIKMIVDINDAMSLQNVSKENLEATAEQKYSLIKDKLKDTLSDLKDTRIFNLRYIYPDHVETVKINTIYVSAPMESIGDNDYEDLQVYASSSLRRALQKIGFSDVLSPLFEIDTKGVFDGHTKAINSNFGALKHVDSILAIYPEKVPTSTLVEIGYGIALCKRLVIFHKPELPFMLKEAGKTIKHVKTFQYNKYSDITNVIRANGMHIFEGIDDSD